MSVCGHLDALKGRTVLGWAWNPALGDAPVSVHVLVDGERVASGAANLYRPDLEANGVGNGAHSYAISLPQNAMDGGAHLIQVTADDGTMLLGTLRDRVLPRLEFEPVPASKRPFPSELAICAIARNEAPYLLEWVAYHRVVGVDHFLIFNNESTDGTGHLLEALAEAAPVEHRYWSSRRKRPSPQIAAYREGHALLRERARWIAFIDLDEFLVPLDLPDIPSLLANYRDAAALVAPWRIFGSAGQAEATDELVMRRFPFRAPDDHPVNGAVKTIVRSDLVTQVDIHVPAVSAGSILDENRTLVGSQGTPEHHLVRPVRRLQLNHYFTKSRAEWTIKRKRGRATLRPESKSHIRPESAFGLHDRNEVADRSILRFEPAVRSVLAGLRQVCSLPDLG